MSGEEWSVRRLKWDPPQSCELQSFKEVLCEAGLHRGQSEWLEWQQRREKLDSKEDLSLGGDMEFLRMEGLWEALQERLYYFFLVVYLCLQHR